VGHGPQPSVTQGQVDPGTKGSCPFILIPENFRKLSNLVKFISIDLFVRKMQMTYQNVQKNEIYILVSKSCMLKLL
jgi:hypothetical protein